MPTLREYKNDTGHYISAWVSEAGNVTYQVDPEASHILEEVGYGDNDKLPWAVIRALRAVGIVGIGGGKEGEADRMPDEFDPDKELENLSSDVAEQLYAELSELCLANSDELDRVKSVLRVEASSGSEKSQFENKKESFESLIDEQITKMTNGDSCNSVIFDSKQESVYEFSIDKITDILQGGYKVRGGFEILGEDMGLIMFNIWGGDDSGIIKIEAEVLPWNQPPGNESIDWDLRAQVYEAISDMLKRLIGALFVTGFEVGDAEGDIDINIMPV